ncbi:uncharacterized protein LOC120332289 [Styela clava]
MDLTGKLIIKARLGDDVRRIPIHNEDLTYNELILMMQRVFRNTLRSTDEITVKYADDDGDLITIFDDSDITLAIQLSRVLKLVIFCKDGVSHEGINAAQLKNIRDELVGIRNRVNNILDSLEFNSKENPDNSIPETNDVSQPQQLSEASKMQETAPMTTSHLHDSGEGASEKYNGSMFDPLTDSIKKSPSQSSSQSYLGGNRDQVVSPAGSAASKTSMDPGSDIRSSSTTNQPNTMQSFAPVQNDVSQNSLHHSNLQSSFGDAALGGPQPSPARDSYGQATQSAPSNYQGQATQSSAPTKAPQPYPVSQQPQAPAQTSQAQYNANQYGGYNPPQNQPGTGQQIPSSYGQQTKQQIYAPQMPASSGQRLPAVGMQTGTYGGYGYATTSTSQSQYPTPPSQPQAISNNQSYNTSSGISTGQPYAAGQPQGQPQQYNATSTPPPSVQQYPPPGGPGMAQPGYGQTPTNPHRLVRSPGGYRARQPGPGYQ